MFAFTARKQLLRAFSGKKCILKMLPQILKSTFEGHHFLVELQVVDMLKCKLGYFSSKIMEN